MNKYQAHIESLCNEHEITRVVIHGRAHADVPKKIIYLPAAIGEKAYFISLHEIGHIMTGLEPPVLERERMAWDWAIAHSIKKPSQLTKQVICALLVRHMYEDPDQTPTPEYIKLLKWYTK